MPTPHNNTLLGNLTTANLNSVADQAITINTAKYIVRRIVFTNVSTTLAVSTAAGGFYTATSKGGTLIVAAAQAYTALTSATKFLDVTLALTADTLTAATIYLSLTTAHGAPATADVYVYGDALP